MTSVSTAKNCQVVDTCERKLKSRKTLTYKRTKNIELGLLLRKSIIPVFTSGFFFLWSSIYFIKCRTLRMIFPSPFRHLVFFSKFQFSLTKCWTFKKGKFKLRKQTSVIKDSVLKNDDQSKKSWKNQKLPSVRHLVKENWNLEKSVWTGDGKIILSVRHLKLNSRKKPSVCERDGKKKHAKCLTLVKEKLKPRKQTSILKHKTLNDTKKKKKKNRGKQKIAKWTPPGQGNWNLEKATSVWTGIEKTSLSVRHL